jgi:uncharacterized protein YjiS (DUF1127 family)
MSVKAVQEPALAGPCTADTTLPETSSSSVLKTVMDCIARSGQRRALRELAQEERLVSDIGLTRGQALREAGKPFWR